MRVIECPGLPAGCAKEAKRVSTLPTGCQNDCACFEILCDLFCIIYTIFHNFCRKPLIRRYCRRFFTLCPSSAAAIATRMRMIATDVTQRPVARFLAGFAVHCTAFMLSELGNKRTTSVVPRPALLGLLQKARHLRRIFPPAGDGLGSPQTAQHPLPYPSCCAYHYRRNAAVGSAENTGLLAANTALHTACSTQPQLLKHTKKVRCQRPFRCQSVSIPKRNCPKSPLWAAQPSPAGESLPSRPGLTLAYGLACAH